MFDVNQTTADYMSVVLTHECNLRCKFCVDRYRGNAEYISIESIKSAIVFGLANGIKDILLIGGEPTLHPQVKEIALLFKQAGFRVIMTTNYTKPDIVKALDDIVDCFNVSYYNQRVLPCQGDFQSDLTIHSLIYKGRFDTKETLDKHINDLNYTGCHLKFSTLTPCNDYAKEMQVGDFLDYLKCEWVVLFNEMLGQIYRGATIKRYDRVINQFASQSYKFHVDGEISTSWDRAHILS